MEDEEQLWDNYCHVLKNSHVRIKEDEDEFVWSMNPIYQGVGYTLNLRYKSHGEVEDT